MYRKGEHLSFAQALT